jgi:copper chaperone CopZ
METSKFKTNIKCMGCVAKVTPHLDEAVGAGNWKVDIEDPAKILSVDGEEEKVKEALKKAGFVGERVQ